MSVIEEKKALRTFIRKKERTLDPTYKAESSGPSAATCSHSTSTRARKSSSPLPAPKRRSTPRSL